VHPYRFKLTVGDSKDIDVDWDDRPALRIRLNSIDGSDVRFAITAIDSEAATGQGMAVPRASQ